MILCHHRFGKHQYTALTWSNCGEQHSIHRTYPEAAAETNTQYTALTRRQPRRPSINTTHLPGGSLGAPHLPSQQWFGTQFFNCVSKGRQKAAPHNRELSHKFHVADTMLAYAVTQQPQPEGTQLEAMFKELQLNLLTE